MIRDRTRTGAGAPRWRPLALLSGTALVALIAVGMPTASGTSVGTVSGSAYGEYVNVTPLGLLNVQSGPLPTVTLPSSGGGPFTNSLVSVTVPPASGSILTTGLLEVRTEGATGNDGFAESSAAVANANVLDGLLTATAISSECRADAGGVSGSTTLLGATLAGHGLLAVNPGPNTVIQVDGATVILNEQTTSDNGTDKEITVNAVHVILGPPLGSGDIIISQSHCDVKGVTTSTTAAPTTAPPTSTPTSTPTTAPPTTAPPTTVEPTTTTTAKKCNAGGGNQSETEPATDCDPGNSAGHNKGKD